MNSFCFLFLVLVASIATAAAQENYDIGFTANIETPAAADDACTEVDISTILEAVEYSFPDFANEYLGGFYGEVKLMGWSETPDRSLTEEEEEHEGAQDEVEREDAEEQAHRELGLFNYNGFCACSFCPPDDGDRRRLAGGQKFRVNKMFDRVNQRTKIRVKQVVKDNTSASCQATKNDWVVTFTRA